jgi:hypothetical protein
MKIRSPRPGPERIRLPALIALACLAFGSQSAAARELSRIDALADAPLQRQAVDEARARAATLGVRAHFEPRLGVPSLLQASAGAVRGAGGNATEKARGALRSLASLYRARPADIDRLEVFDTQVMPNGAQLVRFEHRIDGVEVFRERISTLVDGGGNLAAAGGFFVGGDAPRNVARRHDARAALAVALRDYGFDAAQVTRLAREAGTQGDYLRLGVDEASAEGAVMAMPARVKPVWFRDARGLQPAWYVETQVADAPERDADFHAYVIDAGSGAILFRHRQSEDAAYRVWADSTPPFTPADGPTADFTPHPTGQPDGSRPAFVPPSLVILSSGPISTGDPWLAGNASETVGNNADAYTDHAAPDGYSNGDLRATTTGPLAFDRVYDTAQVPLASTAQSMAAVTQLFYTVNWLHDDFYDAGFDEAAGNAQESNYGRGGIEGDRLRAEAQDNYLGGSRNNANMSTPSDGLAPRMQMYAFGGRSSQSLTLTPGGSPPAGVAGFGPNSFDITASVVLANDGSATITDACQPLVNNVAGQIVLVDRGNCSFKFKAATVQSAGAVGMLLANNAVSSTPPPMGDDTLVPTPITIGLLSITLDAGNALKASLLNGPVTGNLLRVTEIDRDGTLDNMIIAHEWGHYISNRLVADSNGLSTQQARGMGEGWADFHSLLMSLSEGDDLAGTYSGSTYAGDRYTPDGNYHGLRRYPYSTDMTKNPLSFRHISDGVPLPVSPPPAFIGPNSAVHSTGEVWASMLFECYVNLISNRGHDFAEARDRMKRYLVAGYKLTPPAPTFVEARDAILAAAYVADPEDHEQCAIGFAKRGLGVGAIAPDRFDGNNLGAIESFDLGATIEIVSVVLDDAPDSCDADGLLDNDETGTLTVTLRNNGSEALGASLAGITTTAPGVVFPEGNGLPLAPIPPFGESSFSVPIGLQGVTARGVIEFEIDVQENPGAAGLQATRSFLVHADGVPGVSTRDDAETSLFVWQTALESGADETMRWRRQSYGATDHTLYGPDGGARGITWLESPPLEVSASGDFGFTLEHRHAFETSPGTFWDGGVIQIRTEGSPNWIDVGAPAGYNGVLNGTGSENPLEGSAAFVSQSPGYPAYTVQVVNLGTTFQGQTVQVRFGVATDIAVGAPGWDIAAIEFNGIDNTPFPELRDHRASCTALQAVEGEGQSTPVGRPFAIRMVAYLSDSEGDGVAGESITFTAPASGASGTFVGGLASVTVSTGADGLAIAPVFTANATTGSYLVTATGGARSTVFALTNVALPDPIFDDGFEQ